MNKTQLDLSIPISGMVHAGNALGSFNSWTRWITGLLAGLGLVWFAFPSIDSAFKVVRLARRL